MANTHQGQVTERNVKSASARVGFDDLAKSVSSELQVLFPAAGGWNFFWTPKPGDQVVVERLSNDNSEGYITGKVYTAGKMPQGGAPNIILLISDDGKNIVRFDADNGTLDLITDQKATLKFKNLDIEVEEHTNIKTKTMHIEVEDNFDMEVGTVGETGEDMNIMANGKLNIDVVKDVNITTDAKLNMEAVQDISIKSDANINTDSTANTNITAAAVVNIKGSAVNLN